MATTDLRDRDSSLSKLGARLKLDWPSIEKDGSEHVTSGICCAIVFIRGIYSNIPHVFADKHNARVNEAESSNIFMQYAWKRFAKSSRTLLEQISQSVWKTPLDEVDLADLTFEGIIASEMMCSTLWSLEECNPLRGICWLPSGAEQWMEVTDAPPQVVAFAHSMYHASRGIFVLAEPDLDLQSELRQRFNIFHLKDIDAKVAVFPYACDFMIIQFEVKNVSEDRTLSFEKLRSFDLDILDINDNHQSFFGDRVTYNIVGMVHNRRQLEEPDRIRVYSLNGECEMPPLSGMSYCAPEWQLADLRDGDRLTGLYVQSAFEHSHQTATESSVQKEGP